MAVTLVVAMALPILLPNGFSFVSQWIAPAAEAGLLVALIASDPGRIDRRQTSIRVLSVALVVVLVAGAVLVAVNLVTDLVRGGPYTSSAGQLLRVGGLVWLYIIISFSFLFWELGAAAPRSGSSPRASSPTWRSPNSSMWTWPRPAGAPSSSTTSTSASPTPPPSAPPTSCPLARVRRWHPDRSEPGHRAGERCGRRRSRIP